MKKIIASALILVSLAACGGEKTLNTSSKETLKTSLEEINKTLTPEKQKTFMEAYKAVVMSGMVNMFSSSFNPDAALGEGMKRLEGKTADQVIQEYALVLSEQKEKEKREAKVKIVKLKDDILKLENKKSDFYNDRQSMENLKILSSRLFSEKSGYRTYNKVELKVKNNTGHAISYFQVLGVWSTKDRSVPWSKEKINYWIPGGIEDGEEKTLVTSVDAYSVPTDSDDVEFSTEVINIHDHTEKPIFNAKWEDRDNKKLESYLKKLDKLEKIIK